MIDEQAPSLIAQRWVEYLQDSDLDLLMQLYDAGAVLHTPAGIISGRRGIRGYLQANPIDPLMLVEIGSNDQVHISWRRWHRERMETAMRVVGGQIVEQWLIEPGRKVSPYGLEAVVSR